MKMRPWVPAIAVVIAFAGISCGSDSSGPPTSPPSPIENFNSGTLNTSAPTNVFVHTFTNNGDWAYRCTIHSGMTATVRVAAAGPDSPSVTITNNVFTPALVTVKNGGYVKWMNTQGGHTVTRP